MVVKIAKDVWHLGTITRGGVRLFITFDDQATAVIEPADQVHVKPLVKNKSLKRALTDAEALALYGARETPLVPAALKTRSTKTAVIRLVHNRGETPAALTDAAMQKLFITVFGAKAAPVKASVAGKRATATTIRGFRLVLGQVNHIDYSIYCQVTPSVIGNTWVSLEFPSRQMPGASIPAITSALQAGSTMFYGTPTTDLFKNALLKAQKCLPALKHELTKALT